MRLGVYSADSFLFSASCFKTGLRLVMLAATGAETDRGIGSVIMASVLHRVDSHLLAATDRYASTD